MPTQRLDIHRPADTLFDPQAYEIRGVFDAHPHWGNKASRLEVVRALQAEGMTLGSGSARKCGHCGTRIRYSALLVRADIREYIFVGETCLDNRFSGLTAAQFQALRAQARLNSERVRRSEARDALVAAHPLLAWLTYPEVMREFASPFLLDIAARLKSHGALSPRQIASAEAAIVRDSERYYARQDREAQWAAERAEAAPVPSGRTAVLGEIVSVKWTPGYAFNAADVKKIQIKTAAGWRVYMTCPMSILEAKKGDQVAVTVTIEPSSDDPTFGFGKRPMQAEIITQ